MDNAQSAKVLIEGTQGAALDVPRRVVRYHRGVLFVAGGVEDHLHLYAEYPKTIALAQFVGAIKAHSSKWLRRTFPAMAGFRWQTGYAGFSVHRRDDERLRAYIEGQEEHHRTISFPEEYLKLLRLHGIAFDPRYVLDG